MRKLISLLAIALVCISAPAYSDVITVKFEGEISSDPFSLGLAGESFEAISVFDTDNFVEDDFGIVIQRQFTPLSWTISVGTDTAQANLSSINVSESFDSSVVDNYQWVDNNAGWTGTIAGNEITSGLINLSPLVDDLVDIATYDPNIALDLNNWDSPAFFTLAGFDQSQVLQANLTSMTVSSVPTPATFSLFFMAMIVGAWSRRSRKKV